MATDWTLPPEEVLVELKKFTMVKTGLKVRFQDVVDAFPGKGYRAILANSVAKFAKVDAEANIVLLAGAAGEGADLSDPEAQTKVNFIATTDSWPNELTEWVLNRCVRKVYIWETERFATEPTIEQITFHQSRILAEQSTADRINAANEARRAAIDDPAKTGAEIIAATVEAFG